MSGMKPNEVKLAAITALLALLQACSETTPAPPPSTDQSARIEALEKKVFSLETQALQTKMLAMNILESSASVDTSQEVYGVSRNQFGAFLVVAKSIVPHLDGYKVRLEIGNPTMTTFQGADLKIEWGPLINLDATETPEKLKAYLDARRSKNFSVMNVFPPGTYTGVDVVLAPAAAQDVREINVAVTFNSLSLRRQTTR